MANNEPMTAARRAAIKARCGAATPGPWVVSSEYASGVELGYKPDHERTWGYGCSNDFVCDLNDGEYHEYNNKAEQLANASFIAHAREDVPALLAEVERLRAENESLKNSAFEFGVVFSTKVNEMRSREEWLIRQLAQGGTWLCPMPNNYECEWRSMDSCRVSSSLNREVCWRRAAEKATREIPGISGNFLENEGEEKSDEQRN